MGSSATAENEALSDSVCTGLQLINFCQDVRRDYEKGRIYLPRDSRVELGWPDDRFHKLANGQTSVDENFREMLQAQVDRAESLLKAGEPLIGKVHRDLRLPVRVFIRGGLAIAQAIRQQQYDVWSRRPVVSKWQKLMILVRAWLA